jgi:hypothetical protein
MVGNISLWNFLLRVDVVDTVVLEWNQFWTGPWVGSWEHNILISREWVYPGTVHISLSNIWLLLSQSFNLRVDVVDTVVLEWNQFWTGPWVGSWEHNILISREWVYPGTVHISLSNIWLLLSQGVNLSPLVFVTIHKPWHLLLGSRSDVEWWDSLGGEAPDILIHASLSNIFSIH